MSRLFPCLQKPSTSQARLLSLYKTIFTQRHFANCPQRNARISVGPGAAPAARGTAGQQARSAAKTPRISALTTAGDHARQAISGFAHPLVPFASPNQNAQILTILTPAAARAGSAEAVCSSNAPLELPNAKE